MNHAKARMNGLVAEAAVMRQRDPLLLVHLALA